ncbi:gamma-glutamyl-gamma-aminobutyrate hydrolase family protein [Desulforamulus aeronauticus]|uniref:Putative glutamine amidotransferase n=1 Tax=Desulforamulus aeronauticus DSM 10349 TaxID=1121421 RepID=A0A1M6UEB8_9FIRM|nr:gamma-glutamyl-gamma-aminobutyrate hydrolase family protein [Desulforamulus aeronauticus]SHK67529.1 putative glutamine amidotransferase [Desulforamulus aeronauticus DSM 10349]
MTPLIGITSSYDRESNRTFISRFYCQVIEAAGGLPLILPCILGEKTVDRILDKIDGLLLSGGVDVDPLLFGEEPLPSLGSICPERDTFELALTRRALTLGLPILAVCRGLQVLNIAAGGNVLQDIGSHIAKPLKHDQQAPLWYGTHSIEVLPGSRLAAIFGEKTIVNSFHHQAVARIAAGFLATAWSSDGVVEAMESSSSSFIVGIQCHPECMWEHDPKMFQLFKEFVAASATK